MQSKKHSVTIVKFFCKYFCKLFFVNIQLIYIKCLIRNTVLKKRVTTCYLSAITGMLIKWQPGPAELWETYLNMWYRKKFRARTPGKRLRSIASLWVGQGGLGSPRTQGERVWSECLKLPVSPAGLQYCCPDLERGKVKRPLAQQTEPSQHHNTLQARHLGVEGATTNH